MTDWTLQIGTVGALYYFPPVPVLLLLGAAHSVSQCLNFCYHWMLHSLCLLYLFCFCSELHTLFQVSQIILLSGAAHSVPAVSVSFIIRCCTLSFYYYQVLHTLSRLSQSPRALKMCKPGFPVTESSPTQDEEQIYK